MNATDLDTGVNAEIRFRMQQGSFDDFAIDNRTGVVTITRKLDYDKRNTYQMEIVAADQGIPSLSGTASLTISIVNSNDKDPYFTPVTQRAEVMMTPSRSIAVTISKSMNSFCRYARTQRWENRFTHWSL